MADYAKADGSTQIGAAGSRNILCGVPADLPFAYQARVLDKEGNCIDILDDSIVSCGWVYKRRGGCGEATLQVRRPWDNYGLIEADFIVEIYINDKQRPNLAKVYTGYVVEKRPVFAAPEIVEIRAAGFSTQLDRIIIGEFVPYEVAASGVTVDDIVWDLLKNHFIVKTKIGYDLSAKAYRASTGGIPLLRRFIGHSDYCPEQISFSGVRASEVMQYLADIAGDWDWGVDKDLWLYFRPKSSEIRSHEFYGDAVVQYDELESYEQIRNQILAKGNTAEFFCETFQRRSDQVADVYQTTDDDTVSVGKTASYRMVKQTFTTTRKSIAAIKLKVHTESGSLYSGAGFTELLPDWDMESSGTTYWNLAGSASSDTTVEKSTQYSAGTNTWSLHVKTKLPGCGVYVDAVSGDAGAYDFSFRYKLIKGDIKIKVYGVSGSSETLLQEYDLITAKSEGRSFVNMYGSVVAGADYDSIRIYFTSGIVWTSEFYLDEVSLMASPARLRFSLIDNADGSLLSQNTPLWRVNELPKNGEDDGEFIVDFNYYGADSSKTYAVIIEREGDPADGAYFKFRCNSAGGYSAGKLYGSDDGDSWSDTGKDLWFEVYYNQSQELYGLREEAGDQLPTYDTDLMTQWVDGKLSSVDRPLRRAAFKTQAIRSCYELSHYNYKINEFSPGIPGTMVGRIAFRPPAGNALPYSMPHYYNNLKHLATNYFAEQQIKAPSDTSLNSITFWLSKFGSPAGNLYIEIQEDENGVPSGDVIENGTSALVAESGLTVYGTTSACGSAKTFSFSTAPILYANKPYWAILKSTSTYDASNRSQAHFGCRNKYKLPGKAVTAGTRGDLNVSGSWDDEANGFYMTYYSGTTSGADKFNPGIGGEGSMSFNGSSGYIELAAADIGTTFDFGSSDFTIEWWENRTGSNASTIVLYYTAVNTMKIGHLASGNISCWLSSDGTNGDIANDLSMGSVISGAWAHYAVTRKGSDIRTYQNGVFIAKASSSGALFDLGGSGTLRIGRGNGAYFEGLLDGIRITKGRALYTAETSFILPATRPEIDSQTVLLLNGGADFGSFYFSLDGEEYLDSLDVEQINYNLTENGMDCSINAGQPLPNLARLIKQIEHRIQVQTSIYGV